MLAQAASASAEKGVDAAWGTLAAGERNQVAVLMSLLTHESALAAVQAPPRRRTTPGAAGGNGANAAQTDALVRQLDQLMLRAAKASTKSLDGKTVKSALQKIVDDGALGKDSLKLLAKTADTAAKTLRALDKFTGAQLGAAVKPAANGQPASIDASTKVGKAVKAAIDAQRALSEMLAQLDRSLDSLARHAD